MAVTRAEPPDQDEVIGQRCGGSYQITALLGEGGMGAVYLATSEALAGQEAAVKVLLPALTKRADAARRAEGLARFRAEVYAAGKIKDPNIVKVFDAGELVGGRVYMLMEYCAGGSLAGLLERRGALPLELILTILSPIGSALETAHTDARITHRDIKPANILLVNDGSLLRAKLGDFGIAKLHDMELGFLTTGTQRILGSPGYLAPEQCGGKGGIDCRADIYAFGSVLYEAVTGQRPYPGTSMYELIQNVVGNAPFPPPGALRRDLPPAWEEVILGCLAHRREDRIQTIKEVVRRLARSIPNGELLMSYVAPRLVDRQTAPTAVTIPDGLGPAVTQWLSAAPGRSVAHRRLRPLAAAMATGLVVGSGAVAVVDRTEGTREVSAQATRDATETATAGAPVEPAVVEVAADAAIDAPLTVATDTAPAPVRSPERPPAARPTPPAPVRTLEPTLVVRVKPFADVSIDDVPAGTTPVRKAVRIGVHHVVLVGPADRREELDVTVDAAKETIVTRSW
jgi:hypothetical protein